MTTRDLVLIALFCAIMVALGLLPPIPLGFIPVPITAQSLGPMLAGCILGARRGFLSMLLFLLLVAIGLPVLSGGRGGFAVLAGPTGGYIVGWAFGALICGLIAERLVREGQNKIAQLAAFVVAAFVGSVAVVYLFGLAWLSYATGGAFLPALLASASFLPGDLIKVGIAALAGRAVLAGYPLLPQRA